VQRGKGLSESERLAALELAPDEPGDHVITLERRRLNRFPAGIACVVRVDQMGKRIVAIAADPERAHYLASAPTTEAMRAAETKRKRRAFLHGRGKVLRGKGRDLSPEEQAELAA
jgi:hypothetical protein